MNSCVTNHLSFCFFCALCVTSVIYFLAPDKWKLNVIAIATFIFMSIFAPLSCLWLTISTLLVSGAIRYNQNKIVIAILVVSLAFLISQYATHSPNTYTSVTLLGIAYYTCRHIHVLADVYNNKIQRISLLDYCHYIFFLPVMIYGPIHRYPHFMRACQRRCFIWGDLFQGLERVLYGYAKVILIGQYIFNIKIDLWLHEHVGLSFNAQILYSANSFMVLYAVFSGYTDVALGFAKIWGINIEENFNYPLKARNLIEFWQRWHITLSRWCKDYIYLPVLAYSRNPVLSIILAMIGIGVWHQLTYFYLLWACYQALGIILCRLYQRFDPFQLRKLPAVLSHTLTRLATFSWLFSAKPVIVLLLLKLGLNT
jgi:alginate O-acetyltransferase complex protein AlgI